MKAFLWLVILCSIVHSSEIHEDPAKTFDNKGIFAKEQGSGQNNKTPSVAHIDNTPGNEHLNEEVSTLQLKGSVIKVPRICLEEINLERLTPNNWYKLSIECIVYFSEKTYIPKHKPKDAEVKKKDEKKDDEMKGDLSEDREKEKAGKSEEILDKNNAKPSKNKDAEEKEILSVTAVHFLRLSSPLKSLKKWLEKLREYLLSEDGHPGFFNYFIITETKQKSILENLINSLELEEIGLMNHCMKAALFGGNLETTWHKQYHNWKLALKTRQYSKEVLVIGFLLDPNTVLENLKELNARLRHLSMMEISQLYSDFEMSRFARANIRQKNMALADTLQILANDLLSGLRLQHLQIIGRMMDTQSDAENSRELFEWTKDSELYSIDYDGFLILTRDVMAMGTPCLHSLEIHKVVDFFNALNDVQVLVQDEDMIASVFECDFWTNEGTPRASEILGGLVTYSIREYYLPMRAFRLRNMSVDKIIDFLQAGEFDSTVDLQILDGKFKRILEHPEFHSLPDQMQNLFLDIVRQNDEIARQGCNQRHGKGIAPRLVRIEEKKSSSHSTPSETRMPQTLSASQSKSTSRGTMAVARASLVPNKPSFNAAIIFNHHLPLISLITLFL